MDLPDSISLRRDAVAKLADDALRRKVEAALIDPKVTVEEVWHDNRLDREGTANFIPLKTLQTCATDRRAVLAQHHQRALIATLRGRMDVARGLELEIGKLGDAALTMATRNVIDAMLEANAPLETVAALVDIQKGLALANYRAGTERRQEEEWATKKAALRMAVEHEAGKAPDGKIEAAKVVDLVDRLMRGEEAA